MSISLIEGALTLEDLLVSLSNVHNENFARMQETLNELSEKLQKVQNILTDSKCQTKKSDNNKQEIKESIYNALDNSVQVKVENRGFITSSPITEKNVAAAIKMEIPDGSLARSAGKNFPQLNYQKINFKSSPFIEIYCYDCKKSFIRGSGKFTRHMKETICKPYQCHCGKLFKKKSSLKSHMSTHSTLTFECYCGSIFRCQQYLKNHQRRKHLEDTKDPNLTVKRLRQPSPLETIVKKIKNLNENDSLVLEDSFVNPMSLLRLQMQDHAC